ncbi:dephospho-CoA kinase [Alkalihalobacillus pseudalcaliphilus]|uniref:dephospho-CoA kinase n=1 Tax=Alkalihalobacillus pseudalcaliphilus TaxID=79884 RepID=UPI00064DD013|nr:dephospho-CoA kinase [Alkalihalobacillus pseudalcaliphilus]KMK74568.1 dephospho-CoA kinase [Alkalihalobacillus pseudalcaliphilus]
MAIIIGLTGGIASGKSTVSNFLREKGIPIVDADKIARMVVEPGEYALEEIVRTFGKEVLTAAGGLNRKKLGQIVFQDPNAREKLNKIVHPAVRQRMVHEKNIWLQEGNKIIVLDIPLLYENDLFHLINKVLLVYVDKQTQLQRLMARDGSTEKEAQQRIQAQWPLKDKLDRADAVINNGGSLKETEKQLQHILERWDIQTPS